MLGVKAGQSFHGILYDIVFQFQIIKTNTKNKSKFLPKKKSYFITDAGKLFALCPVAPRCVLPSRMLDELADDAVWCYSCLLLMFFYVKLLFFCCGLKESEGNDRAVDWLNAARGRAVVGGDVNEALFSFLFNLQIFQNITCVQ